MLESVVEDMMVIGRLQLQDVDADQLCECLIDAVSRTKRDAVIICPRTTSSWFTYSSLYVDPA